MRLEPSDGSRRKCSVPHGERALLMPRAIGTRRNTYCEHSTHLLHDGRLGRASIGSLRRQRFPPAHDSRVEAKGVDVCQKTRSETERVRALGRWGGARCAASDVE